jgi:UDP-2-acetamido-2,6-beta-L-arabino-hexul-4-ose reductase
MNIIVTGSSGFIASHLIVKLMENSNNKLSIINRQSSLEQIRKATKNVDLLFHLAGVTRPKTDKEFYLDNRDLTKIIINFLQENRRSIPIVFTSSVQAQLENHYGISKLQAEELLMEYSIKNKTALYIYRLPGVFGKWSKPNHSSVVATFCHNIGNNYPITISDSNRVIPLVYIDDVIESFVSKTYLKEKNEVVFCEIETVYFISLGELASKIMNFHDAFRSQIELNNLSEFDQKLLHTYMSFVL